ncbi:MAG TPA: hypothetical protein VJA66_11390 [Thermoanaerobaculia bacterium]
MAVKSSQLIQQWPEQSREATQLVIDQYGEPDEATDSFLVWHKRGAWKRIVASKAHHLHNFPTPHSDVVESVIEYRVPPEKLTSIDLFDGSVVINRTTGEASARCHDVQANSLALNLMHDIVIGTKTWQEARAYYGKEVLDYRRKLPTPYMDALRFQPQGSAAADPDARILSDEDLKRARQDGGRTGAGPVARPKTGKPRELTR